jgi:anti-anti-sigma factor
VAANGTFHYEVDSAPYDEFGNKVTIVKCHGKLISQTTTEMRDAIKPLLPQGGRIVVDLGDLSYLDSSGLGTLVALKASALKQGLCILEFTNMAPRIMQLLRITNLTDMLASKS